MKALNVFAPFWYVSASERDDAGAAKPDATRFKIKGLDGQQMGYLMPEFQIDDEKMIKGLTGKGADLALRYGLVDWDNFSNDAGRVAFNPANFSLIPFEVRAELAMQIIAASYVKPDEKKT